MFLNPCSNRRKKSSAIHPSYLKPIPTGCTCETATTQRAISDCSWGGISGELTSTSCRWPNDPPPWIRNSAVGSNIPFLIITESFSRLRLSFWQGKQDNDKHKWSSQCNWDNGDYDQINIILSKDVCISQHCSPRSRGASMYQLFFPLFPSSMSRKKELLITSLLSSTCFIPSFIILTTSFVADGSPFDATVTLTMRPFSSSLVIFGMEAKICVEMRESEILHAAS